MGFGEENICLRNGDEIAGFQAQNFDEGRIVNFFFPDERTL